MAKEDRGFASMDRGKQRDIASKGGKAAHQKGTAHEWTSEEAREAGRKGGMASHRRRQQQTGGDTRGSGPGMEAMAGAGSDDMIGGERESGGRNESDSRADQAFGDRDTRDGGDLNRAGESSGRTDRNEYH